LTLVFRMPLQTLLITKPTRYTNFSNVFLE